jgi:hypothetical protein
MDLRSEKDETIFYLPSDYQIGNVIKFDLGEGIDVAGEVVAIKFTQRGTITYDLYLFMGEYNTVVRDVDEWFIKPYNKNIEDKI